MSLFVGWLGGGGQRSICDPADPFVPVDSGNLSEQMTGLKPPDEISYSSISSTLHCGITSETKNSDSPENCRWVVLFRIPVTQFSCHSLAPQSSIVILRNARDARPEGRSSALGRPRSGRAGPPGRAGRPPPPPPPTGRPRGHGPGTGPRRSTAPGNGAGGEAWRSGGGGRGRPEDSPRNTI